MALHSYRYNAYVVSCDGEVVDKAQGEVQAISETIALKSAYELASAYLGTDDGVIYLEYFEIDDIPEYHL